MDQALVSLESRFEQFKTYEKSFGYLFDLEKLVSADGDVLRASCMNLEVSLKNGAHHVLPTDFKKPIDVLDFLRRMKGCYPNTSIAYRIMLTVPVSIASSERSFSKLKLSKNYMRSTMSQERLNGLALLSIEKAMVEEIDYVSLMDDFAGKNARRAIFHK